MSTQHSVTHSVETVTPEKAGTYLKSSIRNRRVSDASVDRYAAAMRKGQWSLGQPIIFDKEGNLIDGQHRLYAVAKSGCPVDFNILRNIEQSVHLDVGRGRSSSDILHMAGYSNAATLAALTRILLVMENVPGATPVAGGRVSSGITIDDIVNRVKYEPYLTTVTSSIMGKYRELARMVKSSASLGWFLYVTSLGADQSYREAFLDIITGDRPASPTNPAMVFYRTMNSNERRTKRMGKKDRIALLIKAWNAFVANKEVKHLFYRPNGKRAESFPQIDLDKYVKSAGGDQ